MWVNLDRFKTPSESCFLTVDSHGSPIAEGDVLISLTCDSEYIVEKHNENLVCPVGEKWKSFLLNNYVKKYCVIK